MLLQNLASLSNVSWIKHHDLEQIGQLVRCSDLHLRLYIRLGVNSLVTADVVPDYMLHRSLLAPQHTCITHCTASSLTGASSHCLSTATKGLRASS